ARTRSTIAAPRSRASGCALGISAIGNLLSQILDLRTDEGRAVVIPTGGVGLMPRARRWDERAAPFPSPQSPCSDASGGCNPSNEVPPSTGDSPLDRVTTTKLPQGSQRSPPVSQ